MKKILRIEMRKAFFNKLFLITVVIAAVIAVFNAVYNIQVVREEAKYYEAETETISEAEVNPNLPLFSLFNHWICEDCSSLTAAMYFLLFPIFAVMGYGWSLFSELKNGYIKNVVIRTSKLNFFVSKYIATFFSGGAIIAIPVLLNFLIVSMFIPAVKPDVFYVIGWTVGTKSMFSVLFYERPFLYVCLRILLVFLFGGAVATLSCSLAFFVRNRFAVVLLPFIGIVALHFGQNLIEGNHPELSPIYLLCANGFQTKMLWVFAVEVGLILLAAVLLSVVKGGRRDVF